MGQWQPLPILILPLGGLGGGGVGFPLSCLAFKTRWRECGPFGALFLHALSDSGHLPCLLVPVPWATCWLQHLLHGAHLAPELIPSSAPSVLKKACVGGGSPLALGVIRCSSQDLNRPSYPESKCFP